MLELRCCGKHARVREPSEELMQAHELSARERACLIHPDARVGARAHG
jgi:hypothetical protein